MHALDFKSSDNEFASGVVTGLTGDTVGTVAVWCRPETRHEGNVFFIGDSAVADEYFQIYVMDTGELRGYYWKSIGGAQWFIDLSAVAYDAGDLLHIVVVQDGVEPVVWVNGIQPLQAVVAGGDKTLWFNGLVTPDVLSVGMARDSSPSRPFGGIIYDVSYWNAALTNAEILEAQDRRPASMIRPASLQRNFRFTEGTGTTVKDWANGHDLTLAADAAAPTWVPGLPWARRGAGGRRQFA